MEKMNEREININTIQEMLNVIREQVRGGDISYSEGLVRCAIGMIGLRSIKAKGLSEGMDMQKGFDCSGLVTFILKEVLSFPLEEGVRVASQYFDRVGVPVHYGLHKRGDLVVWSSNGIRPTHIGIMISEREYIHAPGVDGTKVGTGILPLMPEIIIPPLRRPYSQLYAVNPIGFKRLAISDGRWQRMV